MIFFVFFIYYFINQFFFFFFFFNDTATTEIYTLSLHDALPIYISGWQVAADANDAMTMYPDQSLSPSDSVPNLLVRIQNALRRADEVHHMNGDHTIDWN